MPVRSFPDLDKKMGHTITAYTAAGAVTDVFITGSMCWLLSSNKTDYQRLVTITLFDPRPLMYRSEQIV
jgi:hypothetical protein